MTAPSSVKGYVDPYHLGNDSFAGIYLDVLEHVPDLTFPTSVPVYSRMRRDPKLSSILSGWALNITRAQWQLDPAGCRPAVVKHVADGMGLAVKGTDKAGPARLRGVSWGDHLRAAMRMDPFGFAAFELEADVSSGKAQLAGLWERPQWTISHIHTDGRTGLLTGLTQDQAGSLKSPQMQAKNLVMYSRDREGSNWAGTSLLRPSYASWLIKEEVRRAFAVANVRWSAGVPVLEPIPGTNPTQAQMGEAAQVAQAARAGIAAGAATPPGFVMKILGITGSLPPTQEFLRWLDQQCAASALMNAFELGETPNGSRALGTVFVDALHLAIEAEAEFVADVATRQIAARIVDWNWGADEPVPRVVVSGVGSRREVTAESLQLLLSSGAMSADPGLEAWVRREYRLPEREDAPEQPVVAPGADLKKPGQAETPAEPGAPAEADDLAPDVAARQADLDWGLFGRGSSSTENEDEPEQLDLFDDEDAVMAAFNPNQRRDKNGKWARVGGLGGSEGDEGDAAPSVPKPAREPRSKSAVGRPLRVRAALARAKTLDEVKAVAEAEVLKLRKSPVEFSFDGGEELPDTVRFSSVASAREHAEGVLRMLEEFPFMALDKVGVSHAFNDPAMASLKPFAYAQGSKIKFNLLYASDFGRRSYLAALKESELTGWIAVGSPIATAIHEAAHVLDIATLGEAAHADVVVKYDKWAKRAKKGHSPVSVYAQTNTHELIAESFADTMVNGKDADPASREVFLAVANEYHDRVRDARRAGWGA